MALSPNSLPVCPSLNKRLTFFPHLKSDPFTLILHRASKGLAKHRVKPEFGEENAGSGHQVKNVLGSSGGNSVLWVLMQDPKLRCPWCHYRVRHLHDCSELSHSLSNEVTVHLSFG